MAIASFLLQSPNTVLIFASGSLCLYLLSIFLKIVASPVRNVPGPFYTIFTRLPLKLAIIRGHRHHFIHSLHEKYGPFVRIAPGEVSTCSPAAFKTIYRANSGFHKSYWYSLFVDSGEPGIFDMMDPKDHAARRKLFARAFTKTEVKNTWEGMVREKSELLITQVRNDFKTKGKSDLLPWFFFLATDVSGHLMFGESFRTLERGESTEYIQLLQLVAMGGGINVELPFLRGIGKYLPIQKVQMMYNGNPILLKYAQEVLRDGKAKGDSASIFTRLDSTTEGDKSLYIPEHIKTIEAGNLIIAGTDTTAYTLMYIVWEILTHPDIQVRLEEEVSQLQEDFIDADLERLPLLNAVINETLRLHSAAGGSMPRSVPRGGAQFGNIYIPEGVEISTQAWSLHRSEANWKDALVFNPNRWLEDPQPESCKNAFSPFGAGSRVCIGLHLAEMELRLVTALFFRAFKGVELAPEMIEEGLHLLNFFLMKPKNNRCIVLSN